jgi:hypothetical protein
MKLTINNDIWRDSLKNGESQLERSETKFERSETKFEQSEDFSGGSRKGKSRKSIGYETSYDVSHHINDFKTYYHNVSPKYLAEGGNTFVYVVVINNKDMILKIPKRKQNEKRYSKYVDELKDIIVPIVDASWRRKSDKSWLLCEKITIERLNTPDLVNFILYILPIMIEKKVYFSDFSRRNITYYNKEPKIYDYDFTRFEDKYILYPFKITPLRSGFFQRLSNNEDKLIAISLVMIRYFMNKEIYYDHDFDAFIDLVCLETKDELVTFKTIKDIVKNDDLLRLIQGENVKLSFQSNSIDNFADYYNPFINHLNKGGKTTHITNIVNNSVIYNNLTSLEIITPEFKGDPKIYCAIFAAIRWRLKSSEFKEIYEKIEDNYNKIVSALKTIK